MIIVLLTISILMLLACFLVYYKRKSFKLNWPILLLPSFLSVVVIFLIFTTETPIDVRYLEYPAESIRHYPEWKETIQGTKTQEDYSVTHFNYYTMTYIEDSVRREKEITKSTYEYYKKLWGKERREEDTLSNSREFITYFWNKDMYTTLVYTKTQPFYNYFRNVLEIYNFSKVTPEEARKMRLFKRAKIDKVKESGVLIPRQPLVYGMNFPDSIARAAGFISSLDHMFRPILMVWTKCEETKSHILESQKNYWKGGKDNEVVFCICVNNLKEKKIVWSGSFSWATTKDFEDYILYTTLEPGQKLDVNQYILSLREGYQNGLWHPRNFQAYSIAKIPLNTLLISLICIAVCVLNLILVIKFSSRKGVTNEF